MRASPLLAAGLLLAGCLGAPAPSLTGLPNLPALPLFGDPVAVSDRWPGAEPVIAAAPDGTLYIEGLGSAVLETGTRGNVNKVWRSIDDGATWVDVTPAVVGERPTNDGFLAVAEDGTVYAQNVWGLTFQLFRSEDRGATWLKLPTPPLPLLMHRNWIVPAGTGTLHVVQEALPPSFAPAFVGAAQLPLATPNEGLWYMRSDDRGLTWTLPVQVDPVVNFAGQGNLAVSADGQRLYVVRYEDAGGAEPRYEEGLWYLLASEDGGATWARRDMFPLTSELASAVEPVALDPEGVLYVAWSQAIDGRSQLRYAFSRDGGATWSGPRALAPSAGTQAMPWMAAAGPGELRLVWYEADAGGTAPQVDASWHAHAGRALDASSERPTWTATRVTDAPLHEGNICAKGPACGQGEDRRLLDYPWITVGPDGRSHLAVASTAWELPSAFAVYAGERPAPPTPQPT